MCGIVGWVDWENDLTGQAALLDRMADRLHQRGPDAKGSWLSSHAALANRRLIVIDPPFGAQPMIYQAGSHSYALTYNGELYNFRELRRELETRGHTFRTQSDTEVLLHTYVEWGEECIQHLNGIFAFGIWDEHKQQLFLARDHLGVKPLFYTQRGSTILFGSELKALLAHPLVPAELDTDGLADVFNFATMHTPGFGVYRDVHEVRPGYQICFERNRTRATQYWALRSAPHTDDLATTVERIRSLLVDTVKRQLIADVPVVSMLSGGLDSSGISALVAREFRRTGEPLHTYALDFVDSAQHFVPNALHLSLDAPWAERVAEHIESQHHTLIVDTPDLLENLLTPMYAHDLPAMGQAEASLYLLFRTMKQNATVALSGEGADELFGGYSWFHSESALAAPTFPWHTLFNRAGGANRVSWLSAELEQRIQPEAYMARRYAEAVAEIPRLDGEDALAAKRREMFYMNLTRLLPVMLDRKDRMSMATGFEVRVPFCDYRLVEYVWNVPWELKVADQIEKGILRSAFANVLPEELRSRRKSPYPVSYHPSYAAGVRAWALQILDDANAPVLPFINVPSVRALAEGRGPGMPGPLGLSPLERIIQINTWLTEYHVRIC